MNRSALIIIIFLALTALIGWQYFWPTFEKVSGLREDLMDWGGKLEEARNLSQKLAALKQKYEAMPEEIARIIQALPSQDDIPGLLVQLEQLAAQNGLILNNVSFETPEKAGAGGSAAGGVNANLTSKKTSLPAGVKTLEIKLSLTGPQGSFSAFLPAIEKNLRIMDVSEISFGAGSSDTVSETAVDTSRDFSLSLITYYRN